MIAAGLLRTGAALKFSFVVSANLAANRYIESMATRTGRARRPKSDGTVQEAAQPQDQDDVFHESQKQAKAKVCFSSIINCVTSWLTLWIRYNGSAGSA